MNKKVKNGLVLISSLVSIAFAIMSIIAKKQRDNDIYLNDPDEQNPLYKKRVIFIEDDNDPENADGKRGHLEAVGDSDYEPTFYEKYVKRIIDVILSFGGLIVFAPVYAVTAIAIKIDDPGPVFFKQKRIAQGNGFFELIKFRSMSVNTPDNVPTHMLKNGGITKVGAFIRKHSIDEISQFWNIFRGDMSVIGPRPALWNQDYLTAERDKYGANDIKPGLTGLAQISGRDELEIEVKAKLDGEYAKKLHESSWSGFKTDVDVFIKSVFAVLGSDGVVEGGTGAMKKETAE